MNEFKYNGNELTNVRILADFSIGEKQKTGKIQGPFRVRSRIGTFEIFRSIGFQSFAIRPCHSVNRPNKIKLIHQQRE